MKHKHCDVIKAWADGAKIEFKDEADLNEWLDTDAPFWEDREGIEYRIKPQPKPVQYLYVYKMHDGVEAGFTVGEIQETSFAKYIGKIKLEVDDENL